eukprot:178446_1
MVSIWMYQWFPFGFRLTRNINRDLSSVIIVLLNTFYYYSLVILFCISMHSHLYSHHSTFIVGCCIAGWFMIWFIIKLYDIISRNTQTVISFKMQIINILFHVIPMLLHLFLIYVIVANNSSADVMKINIVFPTPSPTLAPTNTPSFSPSLAPTFTPTFTPTFAPSLPPTSSPTLTPTFPTMSPTRGYSRLCTKDRTESVVYNTASVSFCAYVEPGCYYHTSLNEGGSLWKISTKCLKVYVDQEQQKQYQYKA